MKWFKGKKKKNQFNEEELIQIFSFPEGLDNDFRDGFSPIALCQHHVLSPDDPLRNMVLEMKNTDVYESVALDRAIGCFIGNAIGDALGAPLEFSPVQYGIVDVRGLDDVDVWKTFPFNKFELEPGQWTDDFSMALCVADQLLCDGVFNPRNLRLRFLNWWCFGYNTAFKDQHAVGLGGNISTSFSEFIEDQTEYTESGDKNTSGNGSVMRLSPIPIFYQDNIEEAMDFAYKHSKTTHQGDEAAECCRLMTYVIIRGIHGDGTKNFLENLSENFKSDVYSIQCLVESKQEETHPSNEKLKLGDRNWNWKNQNFRYCRSRAIKQPGYIGSYAMDALSMALHCVYTTNSFAEAVLKVANMRGDSDSVAAVTGQIAGAIFGVSSIDKNWMNILLQHEKFEGDFFLRAYRLFKKQTLNLNNNNLDNSENMDNIENTDDNPDNMTESE